MTAAPPAPERRRSRPGSLERPINARLYRGTWLLVGLPLLVLAFSVAKPPALSAPNLPPAFDAGTAASLATDIASRYPDRTLGTAGARGAAAWFRQELTPYAFDVRADRFAATIHGRRTTLTNLVAEKRGLDPDGHVVGRFAATGIRPKFYEKLLSAGIRLRPDLFEAFGLPAAL